MKKVFTLFFGLFLSFAGFSQSCLPEGITFETQAQIDSFQINYPNCTEIEGDVIIGNPNHTNIKSLNGLDVLTSIGGSLTIGGNDSLVNLSGLDNLYTIGGSLQIYIVQSSPNEISYIGNNTLNSLSGLANLTSIGGNLGIINNPMLSICESPVLCDFLSSPNGMVNIYGNSAGCNSVIELATACGDTLSCLPYGNYFLSTQDDIDNFPTTFPDCAELEGDVTIFGLDNITDLNGLNTLTSIGGDLSIFDCFYLTDLTGFENLNSIGGHLTIEYNELVSLTGLDNITNMGGYLTILGNGMLTSLTGLDNIDAGSITNLLIWDNYNLSTCDVQSICDYLASPNGSILIQDNATGCNHEQEIITACGVGIDDKSTPDNQFTIFPNPAYTTITISLPSTTPFNNATLSIYNVSAQQVISQRITSPTQVLDIGTLPRGLYFVRITTADTVMVNMFIKSDK